MPSAWPRAVCPSWKRRSRKSCCRTAAKCSRRWCMTAPMRWKREWRGASPAAGRRRQIAEQMLELRGLRGKSGSKVKLMLQRVEQETAEFEQCTARLAALRAVHARMLKQTLVPLASEQLRDEAAQMQVEIDAT